MRPGTTPHSVSPIISFTGTTTSTALIQNDVAIAGVSKGNFLPFNDAGIEILVNFPCPFYIY